MDIIQNGSHMEQLVWGRTGDAPLKDRVTEAISGLEFNGGCWVLRRVHRYALTPTSRTRLFSSARFNDLTASARVRWLIKRMMPGYGKINDQTANRVFGY